MKKDKTEKKIRAQAVDTFSAFESDSDMTGMEKQILKLINDKTGFVPEENIWRSSYWGTEKIGASNWRGKYMDKDAVIKIQGVKPEISEVVMIEEFEKQNKSTLIRPPRILEILPWDEAHGFEAYISEYASGGKVLEDKKLQTVENIQNFFRYYKEYRKNCVPDKPWLPEPELPPSEEILKRLLDTSLKAYPNHPNRKMNDEKLARDAYQVLDDVYSDTSLEFMHGHFSCNDLYFENKESEEVILFSNLFWKWRYPYYDSVFAYHWFIYELNHMEGIVPNQVDEQRKLWKEEIYKATGADQSEETKRFVDAAFLERAVAGLIIDSFLVDKDRPISEYLTSSTRDEVKRLIKKLKN